MSRVQEFLSVLNTPNASLRGTHAQDPHLYAILIHVAFSDGHIEEREFSLVERLMPGRELGEILDYISHEADRSLDLDAIAAAFPDPAEREHLITFAGHMAWGDHHLKPAEVQLIAKLATRLGVHL